MYTLGRYIKWRRQGVGLSQIKLSQYSGVDCKTISLIERGIRKKPQPYTLIKLAEGLQTCADELLKRAGYSEEEIDELLDEEFNYQKKKMYSFDFSVCFVGSAIVLADSKQDALDKTKEEIPKEFLDAVHSNELLDTVLDDANMDVHLEIKEEVL